MTAEVEPSATAVVVRCAYANGEPADAEVLVYSPADGTRIYQMLRTDPRGRASFVPDRPGEWRAVADDGLGHRTEVRVPVGEAGAPAVAPVPDPVSVREIALAILAFALAAGWLASRRREAA